MDINLTILFIFIFCSLYIQLFLLITFFESDTVAEDTPKDLPTVSITVPCFNEAKTLKKTVDSLLALNYPVEKLSIMIIDDGSTDNTLAVAKTLEGPRVQVIHQKNGGKYTALNRGIAISTAELIGCLDADSEVHPDALRNMIPYFTDKRVMAVTPNMVVHNPKNILQLMQRVEYQIGTFTRWMYGKLNALHVTPGPFSIFRRSVFATVGGFKHAHNTEDMEIACRIQMHGYKILNCPRALVYTITPNTLKRLHVQRVRWTYGFFRNLMDYKHLFFNPKYGNIALLTLPFGFISTIAALYIFGNLLYYTTLNISEDIYRWSIIGIDAPKFSFSFDWFYINTDAYSLLALVVVSIAITILFIGRKISTGSIKPSIDIVYFLFAYGFIAPIWLGKSVYNVVLAKKAPWR
jgi:cellulose synthase/poly-beta-1,6-N-acetylglucosamine synthase-like glycosyltransferase